MNIQNAKLTYKYELTTEHSNYKNVLSQLSEQVLDIQRKTSNCYISYTRNAPMYFSIWELRNKELIEVFKNPFTIGCEDGLYSVLTENGRIISCLTERTINQLFGEGQC